MRLPLKLGAVAMCLMLAAAAWPRQEEPGELTFDLEEVSTFQTPGLMHALFIMGHPALCTVTPDPNAHKYPGFVSGAVLYGAVELPRGFWETEQGRLYAFAIDESAGTGTGYDRLYFDLDRDGDLTNDPPRARLPVPPPGAILTDNSILRQTCFEFVNVPLPFAEGQTRALELMPRLAANDNGTMRLTFVTTTARRGRVEINGRTYEAWLGHNWRIGGWFDHRSTALHLIADGDFHVPRGWMPYQLCTLRRIGGAWYTFSATPSGDRLTARPYTGEFGTIQAGLAGRRVRRSRISGDLASDRAIVSVGGRPIESYGELRPVSRCRVPVGDYSPCLGVWLDDLCVEIVPNGHADGRPKARIRTPHEQGIHIRREKPFVLDFSNRPEVLFASPAARQRICVGQELQVYALLTDPTLDVMFIDIARARAGFVSPELIFHKDYRRAHLALAAGALVSICLWAVVLVRRSQRRLTVPAAGLVTILMVAGALAFALSLRERSLLDGEYDSLTPQVTVARANGEIVAQGPMPFY